MSTDVIPVLIILFSMSTAALADDLQGWMLMARHGECAEIQSLERKIPHLENIDTPDKFVSTMKQRGFTVTVKPLPDTNGQAIQIGIAGENLNLLFVDTALCQKPTK